MSEQTEPEEKPFERPAGVPDSATWVGGPDGGVFVSLAPDPERKAYACTVYNDYTGAVEATGYFRPDSQGDPIPLPAPPKVSGWDGERLHLASGETHQLLSELELRLLDAQTKG